MPVSESCKSCARSAACHVRVGLRSVAPESPIPSGREGPACRHRASPRRGRGRAQGASPLTAGAIEKSGTLAQRPRGASSGQVQSRPSAGRPLG